MQFGFVVRTVQSHHLFQMGMLNFIRHYSMAWAWVQNTFLKWNWWFFSFLQTHSVVNQKQRLNVEKTKDWTKRRSNFNSNSNCGFCACHSHWNECQTKRHTTKPTSCHEHRIEWLLLSNDKNHNFVLLLKMTTWRLLIRWHYWCSCAGSPNMHIQPVS